MKLFLYFFALALVSAQEMVDYDTYAQYHQQYKTILNWSFDQQPSEIYPSLIEMLKSKNLQDLAIVRSNFVDFFMKNPRFFTKPGVYLTFEEDITYYPFNSEQAMLRQLEVFLDPSFPQVTDPDQFMSGDDPKMMVIIQDSTETFQSLLTLLTSLKKSNKLISKVGIYNATSYQQYQSPTIIGKDLEGRVLEYKKESLSEYLLVGFSSILSLKDVNEFVFESSFNILNDYINNQLLVLLGREQSKNDQVIKSLNDVSVNHRDEVVFAYGEWEKNQRFWKLIGFNEQPDSPQVILLKQDTSIYFTRKFKYPFDEITEENLEEFLSRYKQGNTEEIFISEPVPTKPTIKDNFKKIVSKNYKEEVFENEQDVLVLFWSSQQGDKIYEVLEQFKRMSKQINEQDLQALKLVQLKMDQNEVENLSFQTIPCYGLYKKNEKETVKYHEINFEEEFAQTLKEWLKVIK